jgi:hypothetical protein
VEDAKKQAIMDNPAAVTMADKAALLAGALTPKAGETNSVEDFIKMHLSPAKETYVVCCYCRGWYCAQSNRTLTLCSCGVD